LNNTADTGAAIQAVADVAGIAVPNITLVNSICAHNTAMISGGCLDARENTTAALFNSSLVNNSAVQGGALHLMHFAVVNVTGCKVTGNTAREGAGVLMLQPANLSLSSVITNNTASWQGGGVHLEAGAQLCLLNGSSIVGNSAVWGGGVFFSNSQIFDLDLMQRSVTRNNATYDGQLSVAPTNLTILGSSVVPGFVSRLGSDQSVLPVRLNVSGPFGLPCCRHC
jgi:hypothetical protein